ncbi:MAG: glutathione S-transferase [Alphaproteobacteria bacterium BRH_c36]|nr:MAG: glutathione S-transferase [Alphaproteobacteria bacterium BRH_c36]
MKIIETRAAPNPRRVRIFLAEKGLHIPLEEFELNMDNIRSEEFAELNPMRQVPILVLDNGECISETIAICRYLEELNLRPALFGATPIEKARIEMWNRRAELGFFFAVAQAFRHLHPRMSEREVPQVREWGEANKEKALQRLKILDQRLQSSPFLAGDTYSIADITLLVAIDFMTTARIERPLSLAGVTRWYDEVSARPSARA